MKDPTKFDHTGGDWEPVGGWERFEGGDPDPIIIHAYDIDADDDGRARDYGGDICEMSDTFRAEENARLICAAPRLLRAAKKALPYLADLVARSGIEAGYGDRNAYDALEDAIKAAEPDEEVKP